MALYKSIAETRGELIMAGDLNNKELAEYFETSERTIRRARQHIRDNEVEIELVDVSFMINAEVIVKYSVMASEDSIVINHGDECESITLGDPKFDKVSEIVWGGRGSQESLEEAFTLMSTKRHFIKMTKGMVEIDSEIGVVRYAGYEIDHALEDRIILACEDGEVESLNGLVEFTNKLHENTSRTSVMSLYRFLEATDIKIRSDGMVECFKRVRDDYTDCHTGTFDNSIGAKPSVPRWEVDEDIDQTCSKGLHVCSAEYLPHFRGNRVIKVLVHPKDFVAVPRDYNNAKARVCAYEVISEVTDTSTLF